MADVATIDGDAAVVGLIKTEQQLGERALPATRRPGQYSELARFERQAEVSIEEGVLR
jgi:hypothetical protein